MQYFGSHRCAQKTLLFKEMGVRAGSLKHNSGEGVFPLIAVTHLDYIIHLCLTSTGTSN